MSQHYSLPSAKLQTAVWLVLWVGGLHHGAFVRPQSEPTTSANRFKDNDSMLASTTVGYTNHTDFPTHTIISTTPTQQTKNVSAPTIGVRLVNGSRPSVGRLEVWKDGQWGTVCQVEFGLSEAYVACKQLGYAGPNVSFYQFGYILFGNGKGAFHLRDVRCRGEETSLVDCQYIPPRSTDDCQPRTLFALRDYCDGSERLGDPICFHRADMAIDCQTHLLDAPAIPLRLINGSRPSEGRLEVYHNGEWGTVCDDSFDHTAAVIACKEMGYSGNNVRFLYFGVFYYDSGSGAMLLNNVQCKGHENSIFQCDHSPIGTHDCSRNEEVSIDCETHLPGYIQTPKWDTGVGYMAHMLKWDSVDIPLNYTIMFSFPRSKTVTTFSCSETNFFFSLSIVSADLNGNESVLVDLCETDERKFVMEIPNVKVIFRAFKTRSAMSRYPGGQKGFRMLYSFHKQSAVPTKISKSLWNCSSPHWPDFRQHFSCDLVPECIGGEDEADCPYTNVSVCGSNALSVGSQCYRYITPERALTWEEADSTCRANNAHLVNFNTPNEWNAVMRLLQQRESNIFIGLKSVSLKLPELYQKTFEWSEGSISVYTELVVKTPKPFCAYRPKTRQWPRMDWFSLESIMCDTRLDSEVLCKMAPESKTRGKVVIQKLTEGWGRGPTYVPCPTGHRTHSFLACDVHAACWMTDIRNMGPCPVDINPLPPFFTCVNGIERVPYTLVCDFRPDCSDSSDEEFCDFPACSGANNFDCGNQQCVSTALRCDRLDHCINGADEKFCISFLFEDQVVQVSMLPPALVDLDGEGNFTLRKISDDPAHNVDMGGGQVRRSLCPETHFECPDVDYYCLPVYMRCNDVYDCPNHEDEASCDTEHVCPGFYRCRKSRTCLHPSSVCDGVRHCPLHDDELLCHAVCSQGCVCYGLSAFCHQRFAIEGMAQLRFLDAGRSGMTPGDLKSMYMLVHLILRSCALGDVDLAELDFPNILILDLSLNKLSQIKGDNFKSTPKLQYLKLAGNALVSLFEYNSSSSHLTLTHLDLSNTSDSIFDGVYLNILPNVKVLNLSANRIHTVRSGFRGLKKLESLDLRDSSIDVFSRDIFSGLDKLDSIFSDNFKLCCPATLPLGFNILKCHAPKDEISSCEALLRSSLYRVVLAVFAVSSLLGNMCSFCYRVFAARTSKLQSYGVFVLHLCVSDFLMGIYLTTIGLADRLYLGNYLWRELEWRNSLACSMAGFISLLSNEVSAFNICLITLDRFLVLRFPFSRFHFGQASAHIACAVAWVGGIILAAIPTLPFTSHWQFYSQKGICIPLPVTRSDFAGHKYSFGVIVCLNFVLFLLIAIGQVIIYQSIRVNKMSSGQSTKKSNDLIIARRLISVAVSDFLCWFPIGCLGLLSSTNFLLPGEVNVAMALVVMPLNSVINPFLYTLNILLEKRRRARDQRIHDMIERKIQAKVAEITKQKSSSAPKGRRNLTAAQDVASSLIV